MGSFLNSFWAPKRVSPPPAEGDSVLRAYIGDDMKVYRQIMAWTLQFDDLLDADVIRSSMTQLLEIGAWRKLGGRLRLSKDGKLEIHVPAKFTPERPSFRFSHNDQEHMSINEHPLAGRLPRSTDGPSIQQSVDVFRPLAAGKGAPLTFEDYLFSDAPQISVHVTSFNDATLVSLCFPHTMCDVGGTQAILSALSLVMAGRASEVPPLLGDKIDALEDMGNSSDGMEQFVLADQVMGVWSWFRFMFGMFWDNYRQGGSEGGTLFLPAWFMQQLRQQVEKTAPIDDGTNRPMFLSDGDILSAWLADAIIAAEPRPRPLIVANAVDYRARLAHLLPATGVYIQNVLVSASAIFSSRDIAGRTLGSLASAIRLQLAAQTTEPQIRAFVRQFRASPFATGPIYGSPSSKLLCVSNWTKAKFFHLVDFSPAVRETKAAEERLRRVTPGHLANFHMQSLTPSMESLISVAAIMGKNIHGDYWLSVNVNHRVWQLLQKRLETVVRKQASMMLE